MQIIICCSLVSTLVTRWAFKRSCFLINVAMSTSVLFLSLDCLETTRKDTGLEVPLFPPFTSRGSKDFNSNYTLWIGTRFASLSGPEGVSGLVRGLNTVDTLVMLAPLRPPDFIPFYPARDSGSDDAVVRNGRFRDVGSQN